MASDVGPIEAQSNCGDLVQQARTAHLALLAVSFVFLVFALAPSQSDLETAHQQVRDIKELCHEWDTRGVTAYLSGRLEQLAGGHKLDAFETTSNVTLGRSGGQARLRLSAPRWVLLPAGPVPETPTDGDFTVSLEALTGLPADFPYLETGRLQDVPRSFPAEALLSEKPTTLKAFRELWDAISKPTKIVVPRRLAGKCYKRSPFEDIVRGHIVDPITGRPKAKDQLLECPLSKGSEAGGPLLFGRFHAYTPKQRQELADQFGAFRYDAYVLAASTNAFWFFPVGDSLEVDEDLQRVLISRFPERWRHGSFKYSFEELEEMTSGYEELDLDSIVRVVASEKKRRGPTVDVFGAHLPTESTGWWGMLVITGLLAYLSVHMAELRKRECGVDKSGQAVWLALFQSLGARLLFVVATLVLPVGVIILLARRVGGAGWPRGLAVGVVVIAAVLALVTWWNVPRVRSSA